MSSYSQIFYHIIFRIKNSTRSLSLNNIDKLFAYIIGIIENKNCHLYRINGMEDHIHILSDLHPSVALADYVRDIKTSTSIWLKQNPDYSKFRGWAEGYAALTYSYENKDQIINYIKNQQLHHRKVSFYDELKELLESSGIQINEKYFP